MSTKTAANANPKSRKTSDDSLCEKLEERLDGCEPCKAFLDSLEVTITQLRKLPSERLDKVEGAKIRKDVLSRYRILLTTTVDADRRV